VPGSAPLVVLQFRLRQIERAEKLAKSVLADVKKSTQLTKEQKTERSVQIRDRIQRLRVLKQAERNRLKAFEQDARGLQDLFGRAGQAREGFEQAGTILGLRGGGSRIAALGTLAGRALPVVGVLVAAVEPLISAAIDALREEFQRGIDLLTLRFEQEIERRREEEPLRQFWTRYAEDEAFRRMVDKEQARASRAEESVQEWSGRSNELLEGF